LRAGGTVMPPITPMTTDPRVLLEAAAARVGEPPGFVPDGVLRVGVDLGTATCVFVVLDAEDRPLWVDSRPSRALRDGVVVDFAGAAETVRALKSRAEEALGVALVRAATAYPPCIPLGDA